MKITKEKAERVIDALIENITTKQNAFHQAKNYGPGNQYGYSEISSAVKELDEAASTLVLFTQMISGADFSETEIK